MYFNPQKQHDKFLSKGNELNQFYIMKNLRSHKPSILKEYYFNKVFFLSKNNIGFFYTP